MNEDLGAGFIGGIMEAIGNGAKDFVNVQMAKQKMNMAQDQLDSEDKYRSAQVDYLESRGKLAGSQADAYQFNIDQATKVKQNAIDTANDQVDAAHVQVQSQLTQYHNMLNQALQTPEGQDYLANSTGGVTDATGMPQGEGMAGGPSPNAMTGPGSNVVNTVMPGVGNNAQQGRPNYVPTTNRGTMSAVTSTGMPGRRNASLEKAMGTINSMGIDNREDAEYAMNKHYGADWAQNPEAVSFLNQKFGPPQTGGSEGGQGNEEQSPYQQTDEGATVSPAGAGGQQQPAGPGGQGNSTVPFKVGDIRMINGTKYVRDNQGQWHPQQ